MNEISIKIGKEIKIDYLTTTFEFLVFEREKELEVVDNLVEGFRLYLNIRKERVIERSYNKGGYRYFYELGDGVFLKLCGPLNAMGNNTCSLEMKGEGCREFERNNPDKSWKQFLVFLRGAYDVRASRVDIAVDDFSGDVITFDYIEDKLRRKMFTSSFKKSPCVGGNDEEGKSYTFGKRKKGSRTNMQLCIYEKHKEQLSKGKENIQPYWTRYEMRFMHEKAAYILDAIIDSFRGKINYPEKEIIPEGEEGFKILASRLLYGMLDIKDESTYDSSNKNKIPTDPKWLAFVEDVKKAKIPAPEKKEPRFYKYDKYFHQTSSNYFVLMLMEAKGNIRQLFKMFSKEIVGAITDVEDNEKKINKINAYAIEKNLDTCDAKFLTDSKCKLIKYLDEEELPF